MVQAIWPAGFVRIPDEDWTRGPLEELALKYDTVEDHGWYRNLDPTVEHLATHLRAGQILMDYSGGTGILASRLLEEVSERRFGILMVDSSPKFLRLAVEKLGRHERLAFRHIRYLKAERRLQRVQEVLEPSLLERGVDVVVSTNAIHLYYDLEETLRSWRDLLVPGGLALVQSGNIAVPRLPAGSWIIDETVEAIHRRAMTIVAREEFYGAHREVLADAARMAAHDALRRKFFLPVRALDHYLSTLRAAGLEVRAVEHRSIEAYVDQWLEFLGTYHEGVLGWFGGSPRVEGREPPAAVVAERLALLERAMTEVFAGRPSFSAIWTYILACRPH